MKKILEKIVDKLSTKNKTVVKKVKPSPSLETLSKQFFYGGH